MHFTRIFLWDEEDTIEFISYRDPYPRIVQVSNDPVIKTRFVIDEKDFLHGVTLRESGYVDLYYNYQLV